MEVTEAIRDQIDGEPSFPPTRQFFFFLFGGNGRSKQRHSFSAPATKLQLEVA